MAAVHKVACGRWDKTGCARRILVGGRTHIYVRLFVVEPTHFPMCEATWILQSHRRLPPQAILVVERNPQGSGYIQRLGVGAIALRG